MYILNIPGRYLLLFGLLNLFGILDEADPRQRATQPMNKTIGQYLQI